MLNAEENILLPLSIAGREVDREWFEQLVDTVGIRDRLSHRPAELSGGQQQRVAVAQGADLAAGGACSPTSHPGTSTLSPPTTC